MISFIGNRPALQIGRYQVLDYDTAWLDDALRRAALAADHADFPFIEEVRSGIVRYLRPSAPCACSGSTTSTPACARCW